ncbi:hypothetical protein GQ42DRAFT_161065 [Ramicandelaber brevisporus]|nr:hypothetical protein GQ42DRAFT_161065 [Ramicandelaber brevisporus]
MSAIAHELFKRHRMPEAVMPMKTRLSQLCHFLPENGVNRKVAPTKWVNNGKVGGYYTVTSVRFHSERFPLGGKVFGIRHFRGKPVDPHPREIKGGAKYSWVEYREPLCNAPFQQPTLMPLYKQEAVLKRNAEMLEKLPQAPIVKTYTHPKNPEVHLGNKFTGKVFALNAGHKDKLLSEREGLKPEDVVTPADMPEHSALRRTLEDEIRSIRPNRNRITVHMDEKRIIKDIYWY